MKKRILIVDDNPKILEILEIYLRHLGYEPILAKNTREGLRKARIANPTIIILDLLLSGVSGIELATILKQHPKTSATPTVILSALADAHWRKAAQDVGVSEFINKPCSLHVVREMLERLIGGPVADR
jgi:DNA-binding response OmpR family regulator